MKTKLLSLAILAAFALPASAQTYGGSSGSQPSSPSSSASGGTSHPTNQQYGEGGSKRCDPLSGAEKQRCLQDEGAKTDSKQEPAAAPDSSAAAGGDSSSRDTAPDAKGDNATQTND